MSLTKTYAKTLYPGSLFSESSVKEVADRDLSKLDIPESAFGVQFFDRTETEVDGETLYGDAKNHSGITYFGEVVSLDEAREKYNTGALVSNMEGNGWDYVVKTRRGNFQPLEDGDTVLDAQGNTVWPVAPTGGTAPTAAPATPGM